MGRMLFVFALHPTKEMDALAPWIMLFVGGIMVALMAYCVWAAYAQ